MLSFPFGGGSGDVVLCHAVIAREARAQNKALRAHYAHLVVHGVLHLRGYDHVKKRAAAQMERREIRILRREAGSLIVRGRPAAPPSAPSTPTTNASGGPGAKPG